MTAGIRQGPLELAEVVLRVDVLPPSVRSRLAAALARQALEDRLREEFSASGESRIPLRALLIHAGLEDPDLGVASGVIWLHLTWACHHRIEESDPDIEIVTSLVADVRKIIG